MIAQFLRDFASLFVVSDPLARSPRDVAPAAVAYADPRTLWALAFIVAAGTLLRFWGLGAVGLHGDEKTMALPVVNLVEHGLPLMPSGMFYPRAVGQLYLMATSVLVFGQSEWALRFPSAVCGVLLIVLAWKVGQRFLTPRWNLALTAAVALLPSFIEDAQTARMYVFLVTCVAGYMVFLFEWERSGRIGYLVAAVVTMVVGIQFHTLAIFAAFLVLVPGLLQGDARKFWAGAVAFAVMAVGFEVINTLIDHAYPQNVAADSGPVGNGPHAAWVPHLALLWLVAAAVPALLFALWVARARPAVSRARGAAGGEGVDGGCGGDRWRGTAGGEGVDGGRWGDGWRGTAGGEGVHGGRLRDGWRGAAGDEGVDGGRWGDGWRGTAGGEGVEGGRGGDGWRRTAGGEGVDGGRWGDGWRGTAAGEAVDGGRRGGGRLGVGLSAEGAASVVAVVLIAGALVAEVALAWHLAVLLAAAGLVLARRGGGLGRGRIALFLAVSAAIATAEVVFLVQHAAGSPKQIAGVMLGWPSVWPFIAIADYSAVVMLAAVGSLACALWLLAHRRAVPDHVLMLVLGVWVPLLMIGLMKWNIPARYAAAQIMPLLLCAFAAMQWAAGWAARRGRLGAVVSSSAASGRAAQAGVGGAVSDRAASAGAGGAVSDRAAPAGAGGAVSGRAGPAGVGGAVSGRAALAGAGGPAAAWASWAAVLACVLVVNPVEVVGAVGAGYANHPDHKGAAEFVESLHPGPRDIIVAEDVLQQTYYLGHVDYWLVNKQVAAPFMHRVNGRWLDFYTDTPLIGTGVELKELVERPNRGAIYVIGSGENQEDGRSLMRAFGISEALQSPPFQLVYRGRDGLTRVWKVAPPSPTVAKGQ